MRKSLTLIAMGLFILSCKKEKKNEAEESTNQTNYAYVNTIGSYWVYEKYNVDSLGVETLLLDRDTITVTGDTVVNSKTYYKFTGDLSFYYSGSQFQRDSSGYIVDLNGNILYSFNNVSSNLASREDGPYTVSFNLGTNETIATAFGSKSAGVSYYEIGYTNGDPINACGDLTMRFYNYYGSGIGLLQDEMETYSGLQSSCSKKVRKLSEYYIAP